MVSRIQRAGNVHAVGVVHKAVRDNIIPKAPLFSYNTIVGAEGSPLFLRPD